MKGERGEKGDGGMDKREGLKGTGDILKKSCILAIDTTDSALGGSTAGFQMDLLLLWQQK